MGKLFPFLLLAASAAAPQNPHSEPMPVFKAGVAVVRVDAQVVEGNRVLDGLGRDDFEVYDDGVPQRVQYFARESEPLWLALLLDLSGSMRRYLEPMAASSKAALGQLSAGDRVSILVFGRDTKVFEDFTDDRERVVRELPRAVRDASVGAITNINPAVLETAAFIRQSAGQGRRAVLIVTDNQGMSYQLPDETVIRALYGADAVLNAIVVGKGYRPPPPQAGRTVNPDFSPADVFKLAEETGGEAVKAEKADIAFREMLERIRTRYSLHYAAPALSGPAAFHRVRVELAPAARKRHPKARVRARSGYYTGS